MQKRKGEEEEDIARTSFDLSDTPLC